MTRILLTLCAAHALCACTPKPLVEATPPHGSRSPCPAPC